LSGVVWIVLGVALVPANAQSEAAIRGRVVAQADGSALAEGTVTLKLLTTGMSAQAAVDANGRFTFSSISPGEYVLTASSNGFANRDVRLVLEPRELRTVTISLPIAGISVTFTATAKVRF